MSYWERGYFAFIGAATGALVVGLTGGKAWAFAMGWAVLAVYCLWRFSREQR